MKQQAAPQPYSGARSGDRRLPRPSPSELPTLTATNGQARVKNTRSGHRKQYAYGPASGPHPSIPAARVRGLPARAPFRALSCAGSQGNKAVDRDHGVRLGRRGRSRPSPHGRPHSSSLCPDRLRNREPTERPARLPGAGARLLGPRPRRAAPDPHRGVMKASSPSPPRS